MFGALESRLDKSDKKVPALAAFLLTALPIAQSVHAEAAITLKPGETVASYMADKVKNGCKNNKNGILTSPVESQGSYSGVNGVPDNQVKARYGAMCKKSNDDEYMHFEQELIQKPISE